MEDLRNPAEAAAYLNAALEDSDEMFLIAPRDAAEAQQLSKVAETAGVARESIYRMLTGKGNPTYSSLRVILRAIGLKLAIEIEEPTPGTLMARSRWARFYSADRVNAAKIPEHSAAC